MNKIFMVTDGEYSDYHIKGAFSTKKKAENFINDFGGRIEEVLIDQLENTSNVSTFYCCMDLKSGEIINEIVSSARIKNKTRRLIKRQKCNIGIPNSEGVFVESTQSKEHARKCAAEARQKYLRNGKRWENNFDINLEV